MAAQKSIELLLDSLTSGLNSTVNVEDHTALCWLVPGDDKTNSLNEPVDPTLAHASSAVNAEAYLDYSSSLAAKCSALKHSRSATCFHC